MAASSSRLNQQNSRPASLSVPANAARWAFTGCLLLKRGQEVQPELVVRLARVDEEVLNHENQALHLDLFVELLCQFTHKRGFGRFTRLDTSSRKRPHGLAAAMLKQNGFAAEEDTCSADRD